MIFLVVFLTAFIVLFINLFRKLSYLKVGQKENRLYNAGERIKNVITIVFGQSKLLRERGAGLIHLLIFWGFMIFLLAVIEAIIQGFYPPFNFEFLGPGNIAISFVQDIFIVLVIVSVIAALIRRFAIKVPRLQGDMGEKIDAAVVLILILFVAISMLGQNAAGIAKNNFIESEYSFRPVANSLANVLFTDSGQGDILYPIFWWTHILVIFGFMNYLPFSKHFHVYTSIPNVYFGKTGLTKFALKKLDLEDEDAEQFGAADIEHLSWKQMLDGYSCTECGRCSTHCPATISGKSLSPKRIIEKIRTRTEEKAPYLLSGSEIPGDVDNRQLVNGYISGDELWACTTCMACVYECPITIEHVDAIVDMRRNLTLMEASFPQELNPVFKNLETNFTPWAFNHQDRANWAEGLNIKTLSEDSNCEILFWVGCAGSFDTRYQNVSKAFAKIMQKADVDFRILGTEEKCNGDTARRLGNEYLAQMLINDNVETLKKYKVEKIVTACPHCYNSLKIDYQSFGVNFEVYHHTEFIEKLIKNGRLKIKGELQNKSITYHDSCYLGRYNKVYEEPRKHLKRINGVELKEMTRNRDTGLCCGAGGGRMFMEETEGERINIVRSQEAINTGADTIAAACPFCITMLTDGVKSLGHESSIKIEDISEIILDYIN
jgi:Fe-S oxidoreductase